MQRYLIILNDPPYGTERSYNGLRLARTLLNTNEAEVKVFLMGDAASCAKGGQKVPSGFYNIGDMLGAVLRRKGEVSVCGTCMDARGIGDADLVPGARAAPWTSSPHGRNGIGDVELVSQLIEGAFPDYEQIIPRRCETRAVLSTAAFLKACKQAEIFAREGSHIARLDIQPGGELQPGTVEISGQSEETGFNQNVVDASIEGARLLIAFNVRFLREVLDVVRTPNVALETTADNLPGVIRPVGPQDGQADFLHVIMPMHLGS